MSWICKNCETKNSNIIKECRGCGSPTSLNGMGRLFENIDNSSKIFIAYTILVFSLIAIILGYQFEEPLSNKFVSRASEDSIGKKNTESERLEKILFDTNPSIAPYYMDSKGSRYWGCNDVVYYKIIELAFSDFNRLSKKENIAPPIKESCLYSIQKYNFLGRDGILYQMDFYVDESYKKRCLIDGYCENSRKLTFKVIDGKLVMQYMLTRTDSPDTRWACVALNGTIISAYKGCE